MFKPRERIFLPGSCGEPSALVERVLGAPDVEVTTSFVPGINRLKSEMLGAGTRVTGLFMQPSLSIAQRKKRFRHLPLSYYAMSKWLAETSPFDTCIVQVHPPDTDGLCSLGPAAEFTSAVLQRAGRIIAVLNSNVPRVLGAPSVALANCAVTVESSTAVVGYEVGEVDAATREIARLVSTFIPDGSALQVGLGKVPHALFGELHDRRRLRLHSGMLSDGLMGLSESGALDQGWEHVTTVVLGSPALYGWVEGRSDIHIRGVEYTHDPSRLARLGRFIAINSALEVDLFGQCNLELASGRAISGAGGAPDFAHAARLSAGGISIVALPATFGSAKGSRIRPLLREGIVSLSRTDVDVIVTEEGAADLRGLSVHERAEALISVASPNARGELTESWREIAAQL